MIVVTKERLIRGYFSFFAPNKWVCSCSMYEKVNQLNWLVHGDFSAASQVQTWQPHFFVEWPLRARELRTGDDQANARESRERAVTKSSSTRVRVKNGWWPRHRAINFRPVVRQTNASPRGIPVRVRAERTRASGEQLQMDNDMFCEFSTGTLLFWVWREYLDITYI